MWSYAQRLVVAGCSCVAFRGLVGGLQEQLCAQVVEEKEPFGRLAACMGLAVVSCSCLHAHTGRVCSGTCNSGVALVRFSNAPQAAAISCTECVAASRWACGACALGTWR